MSQAFMFSCPHCHKEFEVTQRLAGMEYVCPLCERSVAIPRLRELKQLVPLPVTSPPTGNSELMSWLFSGGLLVAVVAGLLGFFLANYANSIAVESTLNEQIEFGRSQISTLPPGHLWDAWEQMTADGLPDWFETREIRYNKQSGHLKNMAYGLYAFSGIGLLALVSSFFFRK